MRRVPVRLERVQLERVQLHRLRSKFGFTRQNLLLVLVFLVTAGFVFGFCSASFLFYNATKETLETLFIAPNEVSKRRNVQSIYFNNNDPLESQRRTVNGRTSHKKRHRSHSKSNWNSTNSNLTRAQRRARSVRRRANRKVGKFVKRLRRLGTGQMTFKSLNEMKKKVNMKQIDSLDELLPMHLSLQRSHSDLNYSSHKHLDLAMIKDSVLYAATGGKAVSSSVPNVTVIINTWQREECLTDVISHWRKCDAVKRIVVISSDPSTERRWAEYSQLSAIFKGKDPFVALHPTALGRDRLTDRFLLDDTLMTDALFSIDDDIYYSCELLQKAAALWHALGRDTVVGFEPRLFSFDFVSDETRQLQFERDPRPYDFGGINSVFGKLRYNSLFVTQGAISHRKYFDAFFSPPMRWLRQVVDGNVTAEDIVMSLMYSRMHGGTPPVAVHFNNDEYNQTECITLTSERMHDLSEKRRFRILHDAMEFFGFNDSLNALQSSSLLVRFN